MGHQCPPSFLCPIDGEVMRDPVICSDGHSYEREAIAMRLHTGRVTGPCTGLGMQDGLLTPNLALRDIIEEWCQRTFTEVALSDIVMGRCIGIGTAKSDFVGRYGRRQVAVLKLHVGMCVTEAAVFVKLARRPDLVRYIGMCESARERFILSELAPLGSLPNLLAAQEGSVTLAHTLIMLRQICAGMAALVAEGLVHRDLSAHNVLVFRFDLEDPQLTRVNISDFGFVEDKYGLTAAPTLPSGDPACPFGGCRQRH